MSISQQANSEKRMVSFFAVALLALFFSNDIAAQENKNPEDSPTSLSYSDPVSYTHLTLPTIYSV